MTIYEKLNDLYRDDGNGDGLFSYEFLRNCGSENVRVSIINNGYFASRTLTDIIDFLSNNYDSYRIKSLTDEPINDDSGKRHVVLTFTFE